MPPMMNVMRPPINATTMMISRSVMPACRRAYGVDASLATGRASVVMRCVTTSKLVLVWMPSLSFMSVVLVVKLSGCPCDSQVSFRTAW